MATPKRRKGMNKGSRSSHKSSRSRRTPGGMSRRTDEGMIGEEQRT